MQNLITNHLDIWTTAHKTRSTAGRGSNNKLDLVGIKKLRELILELAVRGKLVPQDPNDEPASDLLKKIAAEKERLIKEGKIKKEKTLSEITDEEKPFELPSGWVWARQDEISQLITKGSSPKWQGVSYTENENDVLFVTSENVGSYQLLLDSKKYVEKKFNEIEPRSILLKGDFLMNIVGGSIGRTAIFNIDANANINQAVCLIRIIENYLDSIFLLHFYNSEVCISYMFDKQVDNARANLSMGNIGKFVIPVPPINEQHRIVAKVDELMAFCDQLEQTQSDNIAAHTQLVEALLATLTNSSDHNELQNNWQRIAAHFDTLFTTEHSIDQLKQTILQLAVMGKLVPQDPNDEPASELLKKIAAEKEKLIKEGKIKKEKPLPEITEEEKPFELPRGWEWTRLANISDVGTGATPSRADSSYYAPAEVNWVTSGETSEEYIRETKEKVSWKAVKETNVSIYPVGTLIIAMYGQGKTRGQITELLIEAGTNQACAAVRLIENSAHHRKYIKLFFIKAYDELREQSAGGAQPNLNVGKVSTTVIPLPPLKEQHRIVTKVDELMSLCDTLKTNLQNAQTTQLALADALVEQAVN